MDIPVFSSNGVLKRYLRGMLQRRRSERALFSLSLSLLVVLGGNGGVGVGRETGCLASHIRRHSVLVWPHSTIRSNGDKKHLGILPAISFLLWSLLLVKLRLLLLALALLFFSSLSAALESN